MPYLHIRYVLHNHCAKYATLVPLYTTAYFKANRRRRLDTVPYMYCTIVGNFLALTLGVMQPYAWFTLSGTKKVEHWVQVRKYLCRGTVRERRLRWFRSSLPVNKQVNKKKSKYHRHLVAPCVTTEYVYDDARDIGLWRRSKPSL